MKIGLYFGSFNPVHIGHLAIANYMLEFSDLQKIWFVVSPQNPFKKKASLLADYHRYEMLQLAIDDYSDYKVCDIEFKMPQPSYTIDTLIYLDEKYPKHDFSLIMGEDNLESFEKWKNYEQILLNFSIYVLPRPDYKGEKFLKHKNINFLEAPFLFELSSSFIRAGIKAGKEMQFFMPEKAYEYMREMHFYEQ